MPFEMLKSRIPGYAKDIKLNLSSLANDETLSPQQLWGTFLATAMAGGNAAVIDAVDIVAAQKLSPDAREAAKAAAAVMAMNNVYYKFVGMMGDDYRALPTKLRMNIIANPGVDKADFELWSLAVSAINGCQYCVIAHEKALRSLGITTEQIQTAVRVASVVQAVSAVFQAGEVASEKIAQAA